MARVPHLLSLLQPLLSILLIIRLAKSTSSGDDSNCLKIFKASISDPNIYLSSWDFNDIATERIVCKFPGVDCWENDKVVHIQLSGWGLMGPFPSGLQFCSSLTGLDLSNNSLTGSLPSNICSMVPFLTSLDLSFNSFSGPIPISLSQCEYLHSLDLKHNMFSGNIPPQLIRLSQLIEFNVTENQLTGPIPAFSIQFPAYSFMNNLALCGPPLNINCTTSNMRNPDVGVVVATTFGAVAGFWIGVLSSFLKPDIIEQYQYSSSSVGFHV